MVARISTAGHDTGGRDRTYVLSWLVRQMRWNNLLLEPGDRDEALTAPLFDQGAVVRRFGQPRFWGITFFEGRGKSVINWVSEGSRVPFRWTLNRYRGCSHACFYSMSGD